LLQNWLNYLKERKKYGILISNQLDEALRFNEAKFGDENMRSG